jgi:hypothetical protein
LPAAARICAGTPPSPPSRRSEETTVRPERGGVWHGPGGRRGHHNSRREQKNSSARWVFLTAPRSQTKGKMGKGRTVSPRLCGGEGALRAARAAVEVSDPSNDLAAPLQNLGTCRALGRGRSPRLGGMPRGQARPPGEPLTSGTRGFCIRPSGGVIRGSPRGFPIRRGVRVRRPVLLVAAPRGRRIVLWEQKGESSAFSRGGGV